ncbi:hypothetical protein SNEBB_003860 [Seison nebaliae]|nr:hypothetical protein SNEBB_003860 [Seison nebaliae]
MLTKVPFEVVHVTSEEENHPASELNLHGPLVIGWQSEKFCSYPQTLILMLKDRCTINGIQILSHQYLISSKIEVFVGDSTTQIETAKTARYSRLGYVELSSNQRTNYEARELKSIHMHSTGFMIKLVIHKNYSNRYNVYNQVGVVAISILGDYMNSTLASTSTIIDDNFLTKSINYEQSTADFNYDLNDLAFDMYQDPEVAEIIRALDLRKKEAVSKENYFLAKKIKKAINELQQIGERLSRYEIEKKRAIEKEDFDKALMKKTQADQYRALTYEQLQYHDLVELPHTLMMRMKNTLNNNNETEMPMRTSGNDEISLINSYDKQLDDSDGFFVTQREHNNVRRKVDEEKENSSEEKQLQSSRNIPEGTLRYEDRIIPALLKKENGQQSMTDLNEYEQERLTNYENGNNNNNNDDSSINDNELSEKEIREASPMMEIFPRPVILHLYSKLHTKREESIEAVTKQVMEFDKNEEAAKEMFRATGLVLAKSLKDNVYSIIDGSLKLVKYLYKTFSKKFKIDKSEKMNVIDKIFPSVLYHSGNNNKKIRNCSMQFISDFTVLPEVQSLGYVPSLCTQPIKSNLPSKQAKARIEILENLTNLLGNEKNGMSIDNTMKLLSSSVESTTGDVRELSSKMIIDIYRRFESQRKAIKKHLPSDDDAARKNVKYRYIFDAFDQIDGKVPADTTSVKSLSLYSGRNTNMQTPTSRSKHRQKSIGELSADGQSNKDFNLDNTCVFCGETGEILNSQSLNLHYYEACPLMMRCDECKQITEITALSEHRRTECEKKNEFETCRNCTLSIKKSEMSSHTNSKKCVRMKDLTNSMICPLCQKVLSEKGEESWKKHLMSDSSDACNQNARRLPFLKKQEKKRKSLQKSKSKSNGTSKTAPTTTTTPKLRNDKQKKSAK